MVRMSMRHSYKTGQANPQRCDTSIRVGAEALGMASLAGQALMEAGAGFFFLERPSGGLSCAVQGSWNDGGGNDGCR